MRPATRTLAPITRPSPPRTRPLGFSIPSPISVFRPRGALAIGMLITPIIILLALLAIRFISGVNAESASILLGIGSGMSIGILLCITVFARILFLTVRVTSNELIAEYPWGEQRVLTWKLIDRVDWQMGLLRIRSSDGKKLLILEGGLAHGEQLLRQIILRVSPNVLSRPLYYELTLLGGNVAENMTSGPPNPQLTIAPRWFVLAGLLAFGGSGLALGGSINHITLLLAVGALLGFVGVLLLLWFRQTITLTVSGITIKRGFGGPQTLSWTQIKLVEMAPLYMMMALRGESRLVFLGPFFLTATRRNLLLNTMESNLRERGISVFQRWWLF